MLGGDNGGVFIFEYKFILSLVINADNPPVIRGTAILIKNLFKLNLNTIVKHPITFYEIMRCFIIVF